MVSSPPAPSAAATGGSSAVAGGSSDGKNSGTTMTATATAAAAPSSSTSGRPAAPPPAAFQNLPMSRGLAAGPVVVSGDLAASDAAGHRGGGNNSNSKRQTKRRMSGDGADLAALAAAAEANAAAVTSGIQNAQGDGAGAAAGGGGKKRGRKAQKKKANTTGGGTNTSSKKKASTANEVKDGDAHNHRGRPHRSSSMDLLSPLSSRSGGPGLVPRSLASPPPAAAAAANANDKGKTRAVPDVPAPVEKNRDEDGKTKDDDDDKSPATGTATPVQQMVDRAPGTPSPSPSPANKGQLQRVDSMASRSVGDGSAGYAADLSLPSSVDADASLQADASQNDASRDPSQDTGMDTGESSGPYPVSSITDSYSYSGMHIGGPSNGQGSTTDFSISVSSPATIAATSEEEEDNDDDDDDEVVRGVVKRMAKRKSSTEANNGGGGNGKGTGKGNDKVGGVEKTRVGAERKNSSVQVPPASKHRQEEIEEFAAANVTSAKTGHRSSSGAAVDKHAATSSSHLRSSDKTLLIPINDVGGNHRRYSGRSTDRVTSAVPYVTFGGTGHENTSDAGLSSLHSDLALSGDSSFDAESLDSILESDISVTGLSDGGRKGRDHQHHRALDEEEDVSLGMEDLDEGHAVAAAAAKFNAMSGAASNNHNHSGTGTGGADGVVGVLRRSSYGEYSCSSVHQSKTNNMHESMATVFSNGKTDKKTKKTSRGGGNNNNNNKSSRNDRRSSASSPVPPSRSRRSLVRRSPSSKKVVANLRMNDSCASLLKSSVPGNNRAQGSSGSCNGSVGSGGRSSRGGLSGISGISLSSRSLVQGTGSQEYADASLFDNLDRNWLNGKADDDHAALAQVTVERMCLASFAIMFDGMGSGYPYKTYDASILALSGSAGSSDGVGGLPSCDNVDLDGLNLPPPLEISGEHSKSSSSPHSSRGRVPVVPVAVAHRLWSDVVLPSLPEAATIVEGKKGKHGIKSALESIVRTLTDDMNFLTLIDINGTKCLQLSHEMYADYGHYIAENYKGDGTPIEDAVTAWHAQFAKGLKKTILNEKVGSISDEIGLYSAVALPRHLLLSSRTTAECRDLLADPVFVARRMVVLGCRLGGKAGPSKIKIEKITSHAVIRATQIHIADIDCVVEYADNEEEHDADVAELCGAWQAACASILDASGKKQLDPQAKERQQEREKRRRKAGPNSKQFDEEGDVPDSISTTDSSASETVVRGKDSAPEEIMRVSEDHRKKAPSRRVRSKKSEKGQKKVSFTFDSPGGPLPDDAAAESDFHSDDASTLTGLTGSGASKALREYVSRDAFADDGTVDSGASNGITLRDVLNIDLGITKREAAIGKSLYLLSRSLRSTVEDAETVLPQSGSISVSRASVHDAARLQIKLLAKSIELYASIVSKLSYLLSDDLDMIEEDDLAEMLLFETKFGEDASVMASKRLRKLHDDRKEARSLITTIQLMSVEAWYCLGANLLRASESGILTSTELSDVGLIDRLGLGSTSVPSIDDMGSVFGDDATVATSSGNSFATSVTSSNGAHSKAISCFRIAFSLLTPLEKPHPRAPNANVRFYSEELKASILHEFGLYQFEHRGDMDNALRFFSESISTRKSFLQEMQDDEDDGMGRVRSSSALSRGYMSSASIRSSALSSRSSDRSPTSSFVDDMGYVLPSVSMLKRRLPLIEAVLSSTLEYAALTEHSLNNYKASLAYFQEAIILRATHAGKNSLEVASLQFNMGVVHDDAGEYEASLNRYSESLRIRMQYLEQMLYESDADSYNSEFNQQNEEMNDLEITVILTLKCMGNVYRAVNEPGSALECYLSAIDTLDRNMVRFGAMAPGLGHMHLVDGITSSIPLPEFVLEEMRSVDRSVVDAQATISAADASREELARNAANGRSGIDLNDTKSMSDVDRILREMTNMYSTVIRLIDLKKEQADMGSDAPESKFSASAKVFNILSSNRAKSSTYSSTKSVGSLSRSTYLWSRGASGGEDDEDDESILLTAAYNLGKLYMHFGQYESSIEFLEHCLRTLWAVNSTDGSSGAYSDSDDDDEDDYYSEMSSSFGSSSDGRSGRQSRRRHRRQRSSSLSKRNVRHQSAAETIEEGAIFHLMAKAHAALSDHHRAVRCFVTGLRHYRRDFNSDDWKLAGALYDCGLSYWRLEEYSAAHKCWSDCLVHLDDINDVAHLKGKRALVRKTRLANVLYNLAASNCALGKDEDDSTMQYIAEASAIYRGLYVEREGAPEAHQVGHCYFYLALIEYKHACSARSKAFATVAPLKMDSVEGQEIIISQDSSSVISGPDDQTNATADKQRRKDWGRRLKDALDYLAKAQNIYDSHLDILDQSEIKANRFVKADKKDLWGIFHPMQAHISHLSGLIYDKLGLFDKATKEYASALRLSNILYSSSNVHSASLLHRMGVLFGAMEHYGTALKCYGDSLTMRKTVLGLNNEATADTLFDLAGLHAHLDEYEAAIKAYDDCLKIRMQTEGLYGIGVVKCLTNTGIVHARYGMYERARDCLSGALKVSKDRVQQRKASFEVTNTNSSLDYASVSGYTNDSSTQQKIYELAREKRELASILHHIANVYFKLGDSKRALSCFEEALRIRRWLCGHSEGSTSMLELAHQDFEEASEDLELAYRQFYQNRASKNYHNEEDLDVLADTLHSMGCVYEASKKLESALRCYNESLIIKRRSSVYCAGDMQIALAGDSKFGAAHPESLSYAKTLIRIGCVQSKLSNHEIALSHLEPGLRLQRRHLGRDHPNVAQTLSEMGRCLRQRGLNTRAGSRRGSSDAVALKCYNEALRISKLRYGPQHVVVAGILYDRGSVLDSVGDFSEAAACYKQSLRVYGRHYAHSVLSGLFRNAQANLSLKEDEELGDASFDPSDPFASLVFTSQDGATDKEQYLRASAAFRQSILRSREADDSSVGGIVCATVCSRNDNCLTWLELLFFQLFELAGSRIIDPVRLAIQNTIIKAIEDIDQAGAQAIVTATDINYNFLYLIQE